jgi:hypothetical protein
MHGYGKSMDMHGFTAGDGVTARQGLIRKNIRIYHLYIKKISYICM